MSQCSQGRTEEIPFLHQFGSKKDVVKLTESIQRELMGNSVPNFQCEHEQAEKGGQQRSLRQGHDG